MFLVASIVYSFFKAPREATGDNWDGLGRTLEWSTASAIPPKYNFAITPDWNDYDTFVDMKEHGRHYLDNHNYKDIHMPNNKRIAGMIVSNIKKKPPIVIKIPIHKPTAVLLGI